MAPRPGEVMRSVVWTFETWLQPNIEDDYAESLAITTRAMLLHLQARMSHEGETLWTDNRDLMQVLAEVKPDVPSLADSIDAVRCRHFWGADDYPSVDKLIDQAETLRGVLSEVIDELWLHERPQAHQKVRDYLSRQMIREAVWMADVFVGNRR